MSGACRPTIEQLRQHPWVNRDYQIAKPREPVPKAGTGADIFEPTVNPENLSMVGPVAYAFLSWQDSMRQKPASGSLGQPQELFNFYDMQSASGLVVLLQDERRKASMRKRMNTTGGEEKWFLAPGTHMNAFQVRLARLPVRVLWRSAWS